MSRGVGIVVGVGISSFFPLTSISSTVNDVIIRLISGGLTKSDKKGNHTAEMQDI